MFFARVFFFPHSRASKEEEENCISRFAPIRGTRVSWMRRSFHSSFCFLLPFFLLERYKMIFVSRKSEMADEWKDAFGKERTKGVRVHRGVLTRAGEFLSFFVFFSLSSCYCISSLFFIEEEVNDDFTWRKEHFLGKNSKPFIFEKGVSVPFGEFVSIKIESSLLFFWDWFWMENMFLDCRNMWQHNVSRASICDAQPIMTLGSHEIDRRNFDRWSTLIFDWNIYTICV